MRKILFILVLVGFVISVNAQYTISGNFNYKNTNNEPLDSLLVFLMQNGNKIDSTSTGYNMNGYYQFNNVSNGAYNIIATTYKAWNGANVTDALKVKYHFLGSQLLTTSYQLHAADVTNSDFINMTDAVRIIRRFTSIDNSFTRGDWIFEKTYGGDSINVSPYLNDTVIVNGANVNQDFKALCVGDVNGSFNVIFMAGSNYAGQTFAPAPIISGNAPVTSISSATACPGTIITLHITQTNVATIAGLGLRLDYDASVLSFIDPNPTGLQGNFYNTNTALYSPYLNNSDIMAVQNANGTMKKLMIAWRASFGTATPVTVGGIAAICDLNFRYYGGTTTITWNNSLNTGQECEWTDINGNLYTDSPTIYFYVNGIVTDNSSVIASSITATPASVCIGTPTILVLTGASLVSGTNWYWYDGSCGGTLVGTGISISQSPTTNTTYYVRAEGNSCYPTSCSTITINLSPLPSQSSSITGNTNPTTGNTETYSTTNVAGVTYSWSAPSGWVGSSTTASVTYIVGSNTNGIVSVVPNNSCGAGIGSAIIIGSGGYQINGNFTYNNTAQTPLDSLHVYLMYNGSMVDSTQTDTNGYYQFVNIPNGTYNITATTHKAWGGVNITDAVLVKRHFAGSQLLTSSLKLHAGDANLTNAINVTDAIKIMRRFSGADTSFDRGDWVFEKPLGGDTINVSTYMNDTVIVNGANVVQDFKGLCVGDVNGSYNSIPLGQKSMRVESGKLKVKREKARRSLKGVTL